MQRIDICLVKWFGADHVEETFNKTVDSLLSMNHVNLHIHDNTKDNIGLPAARNKMLDECHQSIVCFMDFDISFNNMCWYSLCQKLLVADEVALVAPVTTRFSSVNKNVEWQLKEYLSCNFMMFRKSTFEKLGGWDEDFFVAYADWDMIRRIMNSGLKIYQHNKSSIDHFGLSRHDPQKGLKWRTDFQTFIKKWGAEGQLDRTKK